ncbi:hypothetical protein [Paenibacillus paridis]|uniref:hypothetical protein n=1 Tax=Paenibacillus paridis TaxID=2583376 RepID=UPI0011214844|nr:hypothetical protein [Paenibacillus paridis]
MIPTRKDAHKAARLAAASALVVLLAGCQSAVSTPPATYTGSTQPVQNEKIKEPDSPQKTYSEQEENGLPIEEPNLNHADTTSDTNAETSTVRKKEDTKATVKTESQDAAWSANAPLLHGIAIGDNESSVTKLYGKPQDTYKLDEETETINVLEYDGFAVGINPGKKVQFVEVYGKLISTGLSGLHIGDSQENALKLLGKPNKQTTYLLTYEAKKALLKLDLDPVHNQIVSIKLLAVNS